MKPVKLDMLRGFFIYLFIYLATSLFIVATRLLGTPKAVKEITGRKLRIHSCIQKIVIEHMLRTRHRFRSLDISVSKTEIPTLRSLLQQGVMGNNICNT